MKSESITKLAAALAKAQAEMPAAEMNAENPFLKNKYADLGSIINTARPVLAKHGLSVSQLPIGSAGEVGITTVIMHESGEYLESTVTMPLSDERGKSAAQVAGSVITYLRRYAFASALGMYADEDTDGNQPAKSKPTNGKPKASTTPEISPETVKTVKNSEGVLYVDLDSEVLAIMATALQKHVNDKTATDEHKLKLAAARAILAERNK